MATNGNGGHAFGWPSGSVKATVTWGLMGIEAFVLGFAMVVGQWELAETLGLVLFGQATAMIGFYAGKPSGS